jgi:hypothetical protein
MINYWLEITKKNAKDRHFHPLHPQTKKLETTKSKALVATQKAGTATIWLQLRLFRLLLYIQATLSLMSVVAL